MNSAIQEYAVLALRTVLYVALFPFTHVIFYILLAMWLVVKHTVVVPILLMLRIALFGLIYLPLTPVLTVADVDFARDTTVEDSLWKLAVHMAPHASFFALTLLHYVIIAAMIGTVVGCVTGLNISVVSKVLTPPSADDAVQEEFNKTWARMEELRAQLPQKQSKVTSTRSTPGKKEQKAIGNEEVKKEQEVKIKRERSDDNISLAPAELSVADIVKNEPRRPLKAGGIDFAHNAADLTYEDDDGYNYMRYRAIPRESSSAGSGDRSAEESERLLEGSEEPEAYEEEESSEEYDEDDGLEVVEEEEEMSEPPPSTSSDAHSDAVGVPTIEEESEEASDSRADGEEVEDSEYEAEDVVSVSSEGPFSANRGTEESKSLPQRSPRRPNAATTPPTDVEAKSGGLSAKQEEEEVE